MSAAPTSRVLQHVSTIGEIIRAPETLLVLEPSAVAEFKALLMLPRGMWEEFEQDGRSRWFLQRRWDFSRGRLFALKEHEDAKSPDQQDRRQ